MRIDRAAHIPWAIFVLLATAAAALLYSANLHPQSVPAGLRFFGSFPPAHHSVGGTPLGLIFGAIALGIFVFAALLGMRKKLPIFRVGSVPFWLRGHIWLTLLTIPLILLHSGFRLGGMMTTVLMVLYAVVMVSGIYGLILQNKLPVLMKERLPGEIVYEQIPNIRAQLYTAAERLHQTYRHQREVKTGDQVMSPPTPTVLSSAELPDVSSFAVFKTPSAADKPMRRRTMRGTTVSALPMTMEANGAAVTADPASEKILLTFIERQLMPYLEARRGRKFRLGHRRQANETFQQLKLRLAPPYRPRVEEMEGWCDERRWLDEQAHYQHWLHGWLLLHAPLSFVLIVMTAWHAFITIFHY